MIDYPDPKDMYHQKLFGMEMGQSFGALFVFEWLLNSFPFDRIIEIGTGRGGLTLFLKTQAEIRGLGFFTFDALYRMKDRNNFETHNKPQAAPYILSANFLQFDVHKDPALTLIRTLMKGKRILMYCDNGNKPQEFKKYIPFIEPGSIFGTHDWHPSQFCDVEVPETEERLKLVVLMEQFCEEYKTRQRFWYRPE